MPSPGIGVNLKQARQLQGLTLADIEAVTKISSRYLDAIESENLDILPGVLFTRNFVRQYAMAVGLDPEPLLQELPKMDQASAPLPVAPSLARSPRWESRERSLATTAAWLVILTASCFATWSYLSRIPAVKTAPAQITRVEPPPAKTPEPAPAPAPEPAAAVPVSAVLVVITAHETTWISLVADGKSAFAGTLEPNQSKEISAAEQVKLVAGNAAGVTVSLNGKTLDPLGPEGQVRILRLTAEGPQFLAKVPPPAPDPL